MVSPQSRLSAGSHGAGTPQVKKFWRAEASALGDPGIHPARVGFQNGAGLGGQGGVVRHCVPSQTERAHAAVERRLPGRRSRIIRPEAARRISSIWNIRSRACTIRRAAAAWVALAAWMRGMPSVSKPISTGPDRPGIRACCDRGGRVSHSMPVTTAGQKQHDEAEPEQQAASAAENWHALRQAGETASGRKGTAR